VNGERQKQEQDRAEKAESEPPLRTVALIACISSTYCSSGNSASPSVTEQAYA
jgi:hypothetical protein